jgi:single-strand DNA-binding protein
VSADRDAKVRRLLEGGCVVPVEFSESGMRAVVRGTSGEYTVAVRFDDAGNRLSVCTCPHGQHHPNDAACTHVQAVETYWRETAPRREGKADVSINRVMLTGNLTRDPELRTTGGGMSILKIGLAVNDRRKNSSSGEWEDVANFVDVTLFGKRAEWMSTHIAKGTKIAVEGKLRWSSWESPSGEKRSKLEVVADEIELLSGGGGSSSAGASSSGGRSAADELDGEEIPF